MLENTMIEIGKVNNLYVDYENESGYYLKEPNGYDEVFLPPSMAHGNLKKDQMVDVFVYHDNKDGLIATMSIPHAVVGEYALLEAVNVQEFGAFFDWGIQKDLLVPGNQQKHDVKEGLDYLVRIDIEEDTQRVYGTTKLGKFIEASEFDIKEGDKVKMLIAEETELGFRVVINKKFIGMIYFSEIFSEVKIGHEVEGYVKKLREDGLVDAALQIQGIKNLDYSKPKIMQYLRANDGKCHLHDKSSPEEIRAVLGMSKKTFKSAIGMLYKDKKIIINKDGIKINSKS
jgi:predicted RNA-binding protein (virulence factor B family)